MTMKIAGIAWCLPILITTKYASITAKNYVFMDILNIKTMISYREIFLEQREHEYCKEEKEVQKLRSRRLFMEQGNVQGVCFFIGEAKKGQSKFKDQSNKR
jgi:hypothetical protein